MKRRPPPKKPPTNHERMYILCGEFPAMTDALARQILAAIGEGPIHATVIAVCTTCGTCTETMPCSYRNTDGVRAVRKGAK